MGFRGHQTVFSPYKGFVDTESPIQGTFHGELRIGPCEDAVGVNFLVTSRASVPIIGLATLHELGLSVDYRNHELVRQENGKIVECSAIMKREKN